MNDRPRLPNDSNRMTILGRTGSGKTQAGIWNLSRRNYFRTPWIVLNFKGDELIDSIPRAEHVELGYVPKHGGIYIVHPLPAATEEMQAYLWKLWERQNVGIFVDEGYMLSDDAAFQALLTQGRSRRIPMMVLSQRPSWITRFAFTEAQFVQLFSLTDRRDLKVVSQFVSYNDIESLVLPEYHSLYFDVARNRSWIFKPVPPEGELLDTFERRFQEHEESKRRQVVKI
jgi:hypothetical protein